MLAHDRLRDIIKDALPRLSQILVNESELYFVQVGTDAWRKFEPTTLALALYMQGIPLDTPIDTILTTATSGKLLTPNMRALFQRLDKEWGELKRELYIKQRYNKSLGPIPKRRRREVYVQHITLLNMVEHIADIDRGSLVPGKFKLLGLAGGDFLASPFHNVNPRQLYKTYIDPIIGQFLRAFSTRASTMKVESQFFVQQVFWVELSAIRKKLVSMSGEASRSIVFYKKVHEYHNVEFHNLPSHLRGDTRRHMINVRNWMQSIFGIFHQETIDIVKGKMTQEELRSYTEKKLRDMGAWQNADKASPNEHRSSELMKLRETHKQKRQRVIQQRDAQEYDAKQDRELREKQQHAKQDQQRLKFDQQYSEKIRQLQARRDGYQRENKYTTEKEEGYREAIRHERAELNRRSNETWRTLGIQDDENAEKRRHDTSKQFRKHQTQDAHESEANNTAIRQLEAKYAAQDDTDRKSFEERTRAYLVKEKLIETVFKIFLHNSISGFCLRLLPTLRHLIRHRRTIESAGVSMGDMQTIVEGEAKITKQTMEKDWQTLKKTHLKHIRNIMSKYYAVYYRLLYAHFRWHEYYKTNWVSLGTGEVQIPLGADEQTTELEEFRNRAVRDMWDNFDRYATQDGMPNTILIMKMYQTCEKSAASGANVLREYFLHPRNQQVDPNKTGGIICLENILQTRLQGLELQNIAMHRPNQPLGRELLDVFTNRTLDNMEILFESQIETNIPHSLMDELMYLRKVKQWHSLTDLVHDVLRALRVYSISLYMEQNLEAPDDTMEL